MDRSGARNRSRGASSPDLNGSSIEARLSYAEDQALGTSSNGVVYQSVRWPQGECVGLFYPNCARNALQARHLDYHWDGSRVDLYRTLKADGTHQLFRIINET